MLARPLRVRGPSVSRLAFAFPITLFVACPEPGPSDEGSSRDPTTSTTDITPTTGACEPKIVGSLWGPCTADKRCDGDETGLFGCMFVPNPSVPQGSLCAPLCTEAGGCEQADEATWCGEPQGSPACEPTGACALVCATNDDCGVGLECFGTRCLWPDD